MNPHLGGGEWERWGAQETILEEKVIRSCAARVRVLTAAIGLRHFRIGIE
jgi:hypothetical protein